MCSEMRRGGTVSAAPALYNFCTLTVRTDTHICYKGLRNDDISTIAPSKLIDKNGIHIKYEYLCKTCIQCVRFVRLSSPHYTNEFVLHKFLYIPFSLNDPIKRNRETNDYKRKFFIFVSMSVCGVSRGLISVIPDYKLEGLCDINLVHETVDRSPQIALYSKNDQKVWNNGAVKRQQYHPHNPGKVLLLPSRY